MIYFPDFNPACALIAKQTADIMPRHPADRLRRVPGDRLPGARRARRPTACSCPSPDLSVFAGRRLLQERLHPRVRGASSVAPTSVFHAHAFDAMNIMFEAIESVAVENDDGSLSIPRAALRDAVFATNDYEGITGTITCTRAG